MIAAPPHQDPGTDMVRGSIVILSEYSPGPGFLPGGHFSSPILNVIAASIENADPRAAAKFRSSRHEIWHGDRLQGSRGEILVAHAAGDQTASTD